MDKNSEEKKSKLPRISMSSIWKDFVSLLNFERGALHTIKGLLLHPAKTVNEYLYEDRKPHAHPMRFLIFSTAISTLIMINFSFEETLVQTNTENKKNSLVYEFGKNLGKKQNAEDKKQAVVDSLSALTVVDSLGVNSKSDSLKTIVTDSIIQTQPLDSTTAAVDSLITPLSTSVRDSLSIIIEQLKIASAKDVIIFSKKNKKLLKQEPALKRELEKMMQSKITRETISKIASFQDKLIFLLVPLYALGTFLFFRKRVRFNYAENLVTNAYLISFQNVISIASLPFVLLVSFPMVSGIASLVALIFTFYFWMDVFRLSGFKGFMKSLLVLCFSYFFYLLLLGVILRFYLLKDVYESIVS